MTKYERITIFISVIAILVSILVPLIQVVWKKWVKRARLNFYPNGTIRLIFNQSGSYLQIDGVFEATNHPITIKKLNVTVSRKRDGEVRNLSWSSFIPPVVQSIAGNPLRTNEVAHPFRIEADSVMCAFTEYADSFNSFGKKFVSKSKPLFDTIFMICGSNDTYDAALKTYQSQPEYQMIKDLVEKEFYWDIGEYLISIQAEHGEHTKEFKFSFDIGENDFNLISQNIDESLVCGLKDAYRVQRSFRTVDVALKEVK